MKITMLRPIAGLLVLAIILTIADSANRCLVTHSEVPKIIVKVDDEPISLKIEASERTTHRLTAEILKIFLTEILGYTGVSIVKYNHKNKYTAENESIEAQELIDVFTRLSPGNGENEHIPNVMINTEVWIKFRKDAVILLNAFTKVKDSGVITEPGYYAWFVPAALSKSTDNWLIFSKLETASNFAIDGDYLQFVKNYTIDRDTSTYYCKRNCTDGMYIPKQCREQQTIQKCALLLADDPDLTSFVIDHIDGMNLYVKVAWVGPNLRNLTEYLTKEYTALNSSADSVRKRSLVILHYTPSSVVPNEKEFTTIDFPHCGTDEEEFSCKYRLTELTKLVWGELETVASYAFMAIKRFFFKQYMYEDLLKLRNNDTYKSDEEIACDWLKKNNEAAERWIPENFKKKVLYVGGLFPMSGDFVESKTIVTAAAMAEFAINANNTVLSKYNITLLPNDDQCKSGEVLKNFITFIVKNIYPHMIGVLGPTCSDTVEPLVGMSKHYKTVIISYSAEGSSFNDRTKYPYFFRTIGENKQYKHVYLQLLKKLRWHRVASLTEDGQKYTEYLSYMHDVFRSNGIVFVANIKFPREREDDMMMKYLKDLKEKRAKIIIADIYENIARRVMCEAYRLNMTAVQGYVWFLPLWLQRRWYDTDYFNQRKEKVPCTTSEMAKAINGHFSLSPAFFASDDDIMQEGITVRQWREKYANESRKNREPPSNYGGYAYDAMWTYAYAIDRLLRENESYYFDLHSEHTTDRLTEIISETDFNGVSGKIQFLDGPSRYSPINVIQYIDNDTRIVGTFYPNISQVKQNDIIGGTLDLNISALVWLSETIPDDGSEPPTRCVLAGLAELFDVSCEVAIVIVNVIGFGLFGIILFVGFIFIKRKYDKKVRLHEKYIQSLGIDLSQTDSSSLDIWEIPRDRVVINRKLGEGAFGTVYGGEALFDEKGWVAIAVKTLKVGSSTDEKLDFLSEVEVMKRFDHKNIIRLLGVCIKGEPMLTVMEFMLYGDLKTYLLARRNLVNDQSYEDSDEISNKKLTAMALDVARALSYLAQLKYIHRDVASRNCLVNAQRVVKLGDFGMTRSMYENDYYKFNRKGMLPVRWMSPESLELGIFTPASDVWSYGVLLYEIVTFGSFPFQGMSNNQVLLHVKAGNCLIAPKKIKSQLENLMYSCWSVDNSKRPTAPEIVDFLATNPRIVSPCLDVPLASVQMENTGQLDIDLPESIRKFSLSWPLQDPASQDQVPRPGSKSLDSPTPLLLDLKGQEDDRNLNAAIGRSSEHEISIPLLDSAKITHLKQAQPKGNVKDNQAHRYVNLQPGMIKLACESGANGSAGNIHLEERTSMLPEEKSIDNVSML